MVRCFYGADFVKGVPQGSYPFSHPSVSLFDLAGVSSPRPTHRVAGARRSGQGWPSIGRPPTGLALMALSTTAYLLWSGCASASWRNISAPGCSAARVAPYVSRRRGSLCSPMLIVCFAWRTRRSAKCAPASRRGFQAGLAREHGRQSPCSHPVALSQRLSRRGGGTRHRNDGGTNNPRSEFRA